MNPDFSIVTPSYNYGRYIRECLESVANQQEVTFEHLIFDAGSTDDTLDVIADFPEVQVVQEPDNGMCDAINKGFRKARGRWVMWLNADDRLLPGALKAVKLFSKDHDEADIIYGCWNFVNGDGSFRKQITLFPHKHGMICFMGCYIGSTATFLKRETVVDEGYLLNESFRYVMDGELYARLGAAGKKFVYIPRVLADFRWHGENLSVRNHSESSIDGALELQRQFAETRAIRRTYGATWFKDDNLNAIVDGFFYVFWRLAKIPLRWMHRGRTRNADG